MKPLMAIVIGATFGASAAHATPPRVVRYYQPPPVLAFQALPLPIYHVAYGSAQQQADPAILERIAAAQERQAAALEKLASRGPNGELADLPPEPEYVGLVRANCAKCHGINPASGTKYSMFHKDGKFRQPTPEELGEMLYRLSTDDKTKQMPPGGAKMDPLDRLRIVAGLTTAPEAAAKMPPGK